MWKNKTFLDEYHKIVEESLPQFNEKSPVDERIQNLQSILKQSAIEAHDNLNTHKNFHYFKSKPWWNEELAKKRKTLQLFFNKWKSDGFPKDTGNISYNQYCFARKDFRNLIKRQ